MGKILSTEEAANITNELHEQSRRIVLAGGCFDILHIGHLTFLQKAKEHGDLLFVLVEADETIEKIKGQGRPINTQEDRAKLLEALTVVDYVIPLSPGMSNTDYDSLIINEIKPAVIATTQGDSHREHKERQAEAIGAKVVDVTPQIKDQSTTRLLELLKIY